MKDPRRAATASRKLGACCAVLCICLSTLSARAADDAPDSATTLRNKAAAESLFDEGVSLVERGAFAEACRKLEASEELDPAVGTLLHLGDCYERSNRLASAWAAFREAQSLAQIQRMQDRATIAELRAASLEAKLARVTLRVPEDVPPGLQVRIGGAAVPRGSWGAPLPYDAGTFPVVLTAPGYREASTTLVVPATEGARVELQLPPLQRVAATPARLPPPAPVAPPKIESGGSTQRTVGVTAAVVGGVGLAGAGVLAFLASRGHDKSLEHCPRGDNLCSPRGIELRNDALTLADAATVTAGVGAAFLATGLILFATSPSSRHAEQTRVSVAPGPGQSFFLSARGTY